MLLAININNTETKVGLFRGDSLESHWRLTTTPQRTPDEWASTLTSYLAQAGRSTQEVRAAIVASVVPPVTQGLCEAVERATTVAPAVVDGRSKLPITLDVEEPLQVGADRILNTLAAAQLFHRDTIVVDFGTATTFDCITGDGRFLGGVIMPGIRTAADALIRGTAKLPATELVPPERVIGRRTEECIRAGVLLGTVDAVDGIVRRIKAEWPNGGTPQVIATGGLASLVTPLVREIESVHPDLTLTGLRFAATAPGGERACVRYRLRPSAGAANRKPVRVRSGCTDSISRTSGVTRLARPPVAITCGVPPLGHSALMRRTIPSTASTVPSSTPARMHSSVRRPMTRSGGTSSVAGSFAVPRISASAAVRLPGMMTPPRNRPSPVMQSNVVAVPKSTTIVSRWNSCAAASVLRMRSAPT